jgi:hypothetical protein
MTREQEHRSSPIDQTTLGLDGEDWGEQGDGPPGRGSVRVYVAEKDLPIRQVMCQILAANRGVTVVGSSGSPTRTSWDVRALLPDLVIVDAGLCPDGNVLDFCQDLLRDSPRSKVVLHGWASSHRLIRQAQDAGLGILARQTSPWYYLSGVVARCLQDVRNAS